LDLFDLEDNFFFVDVESTWDKRGTNSEAEKLNKKTIFGNKKLTLSLFNLLAGIEEYSNIESPRSSFVGPIAIMGILQTIELALYSRRSTTDVKDISSIVEGIAPYYDTLIRLLFRSHCATTVESCRCNRCFSLTL